MNAFNRVAMFVVALALLAVAAGALLVLAGAFSPGQLPTEGILADAARRLIILAGSARIVAYVVFGLSALFALIVLFFEVKPRRIGGGPFLIGKTELGELTVERDGICRLADSVVGALEGVLSSRTRVFDGEQGIRCRTQVNVAADSPVKELAADMQKQIRQAIESQVGLAVEEAEVRVRIAPEVAPPRRRVIE